MTDQVSENAAEGVGQIDKDMLLRIIQAAVAQGKLTKAEVLKATGGKSPGRGAKPLPEFTFPDSGYTVQIRRMGPFTLDKLRLAMAEADKGPEPPKKQVYYGDKEDPSPDDPDWVWEANLADPEYKKAREEWEAGQNEQLGFKVIDNIIEHAVLIDVEPEELKAALDLMIGMGVPKEELDKMSDHTAFIKHVCIETGKDLSALQDFVLGRSIPSEARIQQHEAVFQREVQGTTHIPVPSTEVGSEIQHVAGLGIGYPVVGDRPAHLP